AEFVDDGRPERNVLDAQVDAADATGDAGEVDGSYQRRRSFVVAGLAGDLERGVGGVVPRGADVEGQPQMVDAHHLGERDRAEVELGRPDTAVEDDHLAGDVRRLGPA